MNPFDHYVAELAALLPEDVANDVQAECRSELEDELDDYLAHHSDTPREAAMAAVISRRQSPEAVVAALRGPGRSMIGPLMYPIYQKVIGAQWLLVIVAACAGFLRHGGPDLSAAIRSTWMGLSSSFLITTIAFTLLERHGYASAIPTDLVLRTKLRTRRTGSASQTRNAVRVAIATALVFLADIDQSWLGLPYIHNGLHIIPLFDQASVTRLLPVAHFFIGALIANHVISTLGYRSWVTRASLTLRGLVLVAALVMLVVTGGPSATAWTGIEGLGGIQEQAVAATASIGAFCLTIVWWGGLIWSALRWVGDVRQHRVTKA